ncbi:MAG: hypothetical protein ACFE8N_10685, partial [Promethearchaeota archaeon]
STMKKDDTFLEICLLKLFEQQTIDERQIKNSVYRNTVGFNRPDAYILSDYSIWKLNFPDKPINGELKIILRKKLEKYAMQLSSYKDIVAMLNGLKDPIMIFTQVKNELEVDELDPSTSLGTYLHFKKVERNEAQRELAKKKREEERQKELRSTHEIIMGTIIEVEPRALKIRTVLENYEVDLWFPKFGIIRDYKEDLNFLQKFRIQKKLLSYKREEALGMRRYHNSLPT